MNPLESFAGIDVSSQTEVVTDLMGIAEIEFNPEEYQANLDKAEVDAKAAQEAMIAGQTEIAPTQGNN